MRSYFKIKFLPLLLMGIFFIGEVNAQEQKKKVEGEIVMTVEELESLLSTIAKKRQEKLDAEKSSKNLYLPASPIGHIPYYGNSSPDVQEQIRQLNYKMDLLLMNSRYGNAPIQYLPQNQQQVLPQNQQQVLPQNQQQTLPQNPNAIQEQVSPTLNPAQYTLQQFGNGTTVYEQTVYFEHNSTLVSVADKKQLESFLPQLKDINERSLIILQGFASKSGSAYYNNQLSFNRADAVKQILVDAGIHPSQIISMFHGVDNTDSESEARRVDITIQSYVSN